MSDLSKAMAWGFGLGCGCLLFVLAASFLLMTCSLFVASQPPSGSIQVQESVSATVFDLSKAHVVAEFTGNGIKKTETFYIASEQWAVVWSTKHDIFPANFMIDVCPEGGGIFDTESIANVVGTHEDYSVLRSGPGAFYLDITAGQAYSIRVLDMREDSDETKATESEQPEQSLSAEPAKSDDAG